MSIDLSNWEIKDAKLYNNFKIPQGTIINSGDYLVIAEDLVQFKAIHPTIDAIGSLGFSLNNSEDYVYLKNNRGQLIQSVKYSDKFPWPDFADGLGGSLELETIESNIMEASSWRSICFGGSPSHEYNSTCPQRFTNVEKVQKQDVYTIIPNPAISTIHIIGEIDIQQIELFDLKGVKVLEVEKKSQLNIASLNAGLYLVKISNEKEYYFQKIVVEK